MDEELGDLTLLYLSNKLDRILLEFGHQCKKYHFVLFLLLVVNYFPLAFNHLNLPIITSPIKHHCRVTPPNGTSLDVLIPKQFNHFTKREEFVPCLMYENYTFSNETIRCQNGWEYKLQPRQTGIISDVSHYFNFQQQETF